MSESLEQTITLTISELEAMLNARDAKFLQKLDDVIAELKPEKSRLVGTGEAAEILDVCENTIRRMQKNGDMPKNLGKGKHLKYERATIEKMAQAYRTGRPRAA